MLDGQAAVQEEAGVRRLLLPLARIAMVLMLVACFSAAVVAANAATSECIVHAASVMHSPGWSKQAGEGYYYDSSRKMHKGWVKSKGSWYLLDRSSGAMRTGWAKDKGKWYYLGDDGRMRTGWIKVSGTGYFLEPSGAMVTGWVRTGSKWYYLSSSGAMLKSCWIGSYYVQADGSMASDTWVGNYHVGYDGKWDKTKIIRRCDVAFIHA